jgi:outer membrane protein assembly factor BamA
LAIALAAAGTASVRAAQPPAQDPTRHYGKTVTGVRMEIEGRGTPLPQFQTLVSVRPGEPLRQEDVRATLSRLSALPGFEPNVHAEVNETPGGVEIVFHLDPRHPVDSVDLRGDTGMTPDELRRLVNQRYGGVPTGIPPVNVERTVQQMLVDRGYPRASVLATTEETHDPDRATLVLTVTAGPLARIGTVRVTGAPPIDEETILNRVGARQGDPYRRRSIIDALEDIENDLRQQGYFEAETRQLPAFRDDGVTVDLTLEIEAGPRVRLEFTGDPPPGNWKDLVPIERERSADVDIVNDAQRDLEAALRNDGYRNARVTVAREEAPGSGVLVITYAIARGPRYRLLRVDVPPNLSVPEQTIRELLGLKDGEVLRENRVQEGRARVYQEYLSRGFYQVSVAPEYEEPGTTTGRGEPLMIVRPNITEGPRATIRDVRFAFTSGNLVPEPAVREVMQSTPGEPFIRAEALADALRIEDFYRNLGFRTAMVSVAIPPSESQTDVTLMYTVDEGPRVVVSDIVVVGNQNASTGVILDEITLRPGEPFGAAAELESRRNLLALGVFRNVQILEQGRLPGESQTTLIVSVEELPSNVVGFGFGVEAGRRPRTAIGGGLEDHLEIAPRGMFEIGRRNLGGRNRSVNFFSRIALKPRTAPGDPERDGRGFGFSEYRVTATYNERRAFRTATDLLIGVTSEQAVRTSFNFIRRGANAEFLRRLTGAVNVYGRYSLDFTRLLDERIPPDEQPLIDRAFPQVRLSLLSTGAIWDRRMPNALDPTRGTFSSFDVEVALRGLGSEVGYAKVFGQVHAFRELRLGRPVVAAARAQVGLAKGFARQVPVLDGSGQPVPGPNGEPLFDTITDLPASQRFFAGGSNTVRGFQLDRLGVPEVLNANGLSNGGNGVVVLNLELRNPIGRLFDRELSGVVFLDAGNVFRRAGDVDLGRLRTAWGLGARYDSPLGSVRLDFGFKTARNVVGGQRERAWEYHLSFGQAF